MGVDEMTFDSAGKRVRGVRDDGSELFIESGGYFAGFGEMSVVECNGLVGGLGGLLPRKG